MTNPRAVLVLGATGYVGGRLMPRLLEAGLAVRCLVRTPEKLAHLPWAGAVEVVRGDLLGDVGAAFEGVETVVHLVHSMGSAPEFADADRRIARRVVGEAERAGVRRIVYLGGLGEVDDRTSSHLRSRAEVGEILLGSPVPTTVLRAAVVIGSGSASFEMLRHLVEKLPVMVAPRWLHSRVQPIAIRDVLRYLVGVVGQTDDDDHVYDIGGPDVLTYLEMMQTYARVAGLPRRVVIVLPLLTPGLSSHWIGLVSPVPTALAKPLVHSLSSDVVVRVGTDEIAALVPGECIPYERALEMALARIRDHDVETSWREAEFSERAAAEPFPGDPAWAGGVLYRDIRSARTRASSQEAFATVCRLGGERGWPTYGWAWALRGFADRLIGGVGLRRGRRDPETLRVGDALDFWRVEDLCEPAAHDGRGLLRLRAEMIVPGQAWLEFRIEPDGAGAVLHQRALFAPKGVLGRAYWWALVPFHGFIFAAMVRVLAQRAEDGLPEDEPLARSA